LSENIRVRSILGRYLEHSRIFMFENECDPQVYIGSADMMHRNLDRRVEALVRLPQSEHIAELTELFDLAMDDGTASWWLEPDGTWIRHTVDASGATLIDLQDHLMKQISKRRRQGGLR
jgi:polyphosphate kinase